MYMYIVYTELGEFAGDISEGGWGWWRVGDGLYLFGQYLVTERRRHQRQSGSNGNYADVHFTNLEFFGLI